MKVNCSKCHQTHRPGEIETINIEEDIQGYDLLTYICPVTKEKTKAYIIGGPDEYFTDEEEDYICKSY